MFTSLEPQVVAKFVRNWGAGIFTSTQFIKQGELPNGDLAYKENSLAAAKVTREFLTNEGVLEDKINSSINSTVDEMFGKPYQKTLMDNCYKFIFKLIPNGKELTATLMFEIDNPISRAAFLGKVGGIEETVFMKINGEKIKAIPEEDVDRTSAEGKASSVQFIHFNFTDDQIAKFKSEEIEVEIGIDHKEYSHTTKLSVENKKSLSADFS